jgi:cysteine synthase/rhodanese-related sulfurtransferase
MIVKKITDLIGNTPLLEIHTSVHKLKNIKVYAKLEMMNPFGSLKDRVALAMFERAKDEVLKNNKILLESSSGNTAKALSVLCNIEGIPFKTVTSRIKYPEVRMILQLLDTLIEELPGISECPDPFDMNDFLAVAKKLALSEPDKYTLTDQYFNELNPKAHYLTTAREIIEDIGNVNFLFAFLGTCGSSKGLGECIREHSQQSKIIGVVSSPGNVVPGGRMSNELWEVGFFERNFYDEILEGSIDNAIEGMSILNKKCGVLCGPTSGLNYYAGMRRLVEIDAQISAQKNAGEVSPDATFNAVFIICDRLEPYTSFVKKHKPEIFSRKTSSRKTISEVSELMISSVEEIPPDLLYKNIKTYTHIVDIRGYFAYSSGHIKQSVNIVDEIFTQLVEQGRIFPKESKIVIVCSIGDISRRYAAFLKSQGIEAYSLKGGLMAWRKMQFPFETS